MKIPMIILSSDGTWKALRPGYNAFDHFFPGWRQVLDVSVWFETIGPVGLCKGYKLVKNGKKPFGQMLLEAAKSMEEKPFLLWLDDYLICDVQPGKLIEHYNEIYTHSEIGQLRLLPCPGPGYPWSEQLGRVGPHTAYSISLQAAFWRYGALAEVVHLLDTPWDIEVQGSIRAAQKSSYTYLGTYENIVSYNNLYRRGVRQENVWSWAKENGLC